MSRHIGLPVWIFVLLFCAAPILAQTEKIAELVRRADTAFDDEDRKLALKLYLQVVNLNPEQSHAIYRLGQLAGSDEAALAWFVRYVRLEPDDAWGWIAVGDKYLRVGKVIEARDAYRRAAKLAPQAKEIRPRLDRAGVRAAPVLEPLGGVTGDSDGNRTWKFGLSGDAALRSGFRIGAKATRAHISDGLTAAILDEGLFRLQGRPRAALRLEAAGGGVRLSALGSSAWTTPEAAFRLRWNSADNAASFDFRVQRMPLGTTPLMVTNRAMRNELRLDGTVPVGPVRVRVGGRGADIETAVEKKNRKTQGDAALVFPIGWRGELSAQYHRIGFQRISRAGYFAPKRVETIEGGTYWEIGGDGRWSAEVDLGIGMQRLAIQPQNVGPWKPALRAWGMWNVDVTRTMAVKTEMEAYIAPFAPAGVSTSPNWRYASLIFSLVFRVF
jgi:hypothetical protein